MKNVNRLIINFIYNALSVSGTSSAFRRKKKYVCIVLLLLITLVGLPNYSLCSQTTLTWEAPTTNEDGTPLTDLGGYFLYFDRYKLDVGNVTTFKFEEIPMALICFKVTAYDTSGNESKWEKVECKTPE